MSLVLQVHFEYIDICCNIAHTKIPLLHCIIYMQPWRQVDIDILTVIALTPGGNSTVHIYTQTIHRTTQLTTLVGRLSGIRTQSD
jgi:uncharacterized integral membrane protein